MTSTTEALIQEHIPLVRRLALRMATKLPANIELDDLIQAGMIGLLDAARRFQKERGAQFTSYATTRINGSMMDELRRQDWLPRNARAQSKQIEIAIRAVEQVLGRSATDADIAKHMGLSTEAFSELLDEAKGVQVVLYEDLSPEHQRSASGHSDLLESIANEDESPLDTLVHHEFKTRLAQAISQLPANEKLVLSLAYEQDLNYSEISEVMNLSRGRVSQIRTQAITRLRAALHATSWETMPELKSLSFTT